MDQTDRTNLRLLAVVVTVLTTVLTGWYLVFAPTVLRVAVAPAGGEVAQFMLSLAKALERERSSLRLVVVPMADVEQGTAALDRQKVDLAVVRTDYVMPASALGIATMYNSKVVLAAREASGINHLADLRGKKVGIVGRGYGNPALFDKLLPFVGLRHEDVEITLLTSLADIEAKSRDAELDAIFLVGPQGGAVIREGVRGFSAATGEPLRLVPIPEAPIISRQNRPMQPDEIAAGEITASPVWPPETQATVAFPVLLVASSRLSKDIAYEFTRLLFSLKTSLLRQHPVAGRIEALPTERDSFFAVHPGAATYFDASEVSFLERYSDALWLLVLGFGSITSIAAWAASLIFANRKTKVAEDHGALIALIDEARAATTRAQLDQVEHHIDIIVAHASQQFLRGRLSTDQQPAFDLVLARLQRVIDTRRQELKR